MAAWTQCRTRLTLLAPDANRAGASDLAEAPEPSIAPAATWRVGLEEFRADAWKRIQEWSYAERSQVDHSLAALGLRQEQVEVLYRDGELEMGG